MKKYATLVLCLFALGGCEYSVSGCDGPVCFSSHHGEEEEESSCDGDAGCASVCPDRQSVDESMLRELVLARRLYLSCPAASNPEPATLTIDDTLDDAALLHAQDMAEFGFNAVIGTDGLDVSERVAQVADPDFAFDTHLAQLVASGAADAEEAVDYWLESPAYCAVLLSENFSRLGASCASGEGDRTRWSVVLGGR